MRPRRASPIGTSDRSSTRLPNYRGLGVAHDLTRVTEGFRIAVDDFVERYSLRVGDLDDAASRRRERHIGDDGSNKGLDQFLLGQLGEEIPIVGQPVASDDGSHGMVRHDGCGLRREKVAAGGLEAFHHRRVFE